MHLQLALGTACLDLPTLVAPLALTCLHCLLDFGLCICSLHLQLALGTGCLDLLTWFVDFGSCICSLHLQLALGTGCLDLLILLTSSSRLGLVFLQFAPSARTWRGKPSVAYIVFSATLLSLLQLGYLHFASSARTWHWMP